MSDSDCIFVVGRTGKRQKLYKDFCKTCEKDKGFIRKDRLNKDCHACNSAKQAKIGATHNGKHDEVAARNRELRKKQIIVITDKTKKKISESNRKTWYERRVLKEQPWNFNKTVRTQEQKRIRKNFSSLMGNRLRRRLANKKGNSSFEIVGYSIEELMIHLESKFLPNMTWENYGEWHIDHIKPDSAFNYKSLHDEDFKECWSLANLQPLWAKDNLSKGAKYNP